RKLAALEEHAPLQYERLHLRPAGTLDHPVVAPAFEVLLHVHLDAEPGTLLKAAVAERVAAARQVVARPRRVCGALGVARRPANAFARASRRRKFSSRWRMSARSDGVFGSKTAHCICCSSARCSIVTSRRTLSCRHAGSRESVRAAVRRMPSRSCR